MQSQFIQHGNTINIESKEAVQAYDKLRPGVYTVHFNGMTGQYYLKTADQFSNPSKLYGSVTKDSDRIIRTFMDRPAQTGVLLSGEKGSGKSLLAKQISIDCLNMGIPTLVINESHLGETFNRFIQSITQPTVVLFDEFEKVYDNDQQEVMLTLLDGTYSSKKLFVMTVNDPWRVNNHMKNRPGRIFYSLEYSGLEPEFISEYCDDNLKNKAHKTAICNMTMLFEVFNFDMLKAIVEEVNRYDEAPKDVIRILNTKPNYDEGRMFDVVVRSQYFNSLPTSTSLSPLLDSTSRFVLNVKMNDAVFEPVKHQFAKETTNRPKRPVTRPKQDQDVVVGIKYTPTTAGEIISDDEYNELTISKKEMTYSTITFSPDDAILVDAENNMFVFNAKANFEHYVIPVVVELKLAKYTSPSYYNLI